MSASYDPVWDEIYGRGDMLNRYPFDGVVTFIYRHAPRDRPRPEVKILEVGCGSGNNLWFAAREGFQIAGIDGSRSAIDYARKRFAAESLAGDFRVGDFTSLPFEDGAFDLAIDRGALTCCGFQAAANAAGELRRVLKPSGKFFCNVYGQQSTSFAASEPGPDGVRVNIMDGTLKGVGQICFYSEEDVRRLSAGWEVLSLQHQKMEDIASDPPQIHAEWRMILQNLRGLSG